MFSFTPARHKSTQLAYSICTGSVLRADCWVAAVNVMQADIDGESTASLPRKRRRHGHLKSRDGPRSFVEILAWAQQFVSAASDMLTACGHPLGFRVAKFVVVVTTCYSGMGIPEAAFPFIQAALKAHGVQMEYQIYGGTEIDLDCRHGLLHHPQATRPQHLFDDIHKRVPAELLTKLEKCQARYRGQYEAEFNLPLPVETTPAKRRRRLHAKYGRKFLHAAIKILESHPWDRCTKVGCGNICSNSLGREFALLPWVQVGDVCPSTIATANSDNNEKISDGCSNTHSNNPCKSSNHKGNNNNNSQLPTHACHTTQLWRAKFKVGYRAFAWAPMGQFVLFPEAYCHVHNRDCPLWPEMAPGCLHVEIAGNTCTPWSTRGLGMRWLDPHSVTCLIWMFSVRAARPTFIVNECTPAFEAFLFRFLFKSYGFFTSVICPTDFGVPSSRPRRYTWLWDSEHVEPIAAIDVDLLGSLCFAKLEIDGSVFLRATEEQVKSFLDTLAAARGIPPRVDGRKFSCRQVLTFSNRQRLQIFEKIIANNPKYSPSGASGLPCFFFDITQNGDKREHIVSQVPCLLRRSLIWCTAVRRLMVPIEQMLVQGLPLLLPPDCEFAAWAPWSQEYIDAMATSVIRSMTGNSMSLPVVGRVLLMLLLVTQAKTQAG